MFFFSVYLFVCFLVGLPKNYSIDFFYKIQWKGATRAAEETVRL